MFFASDNTGPAAPQVLEAVIAANQGYAMPYGNDPATHQVEARLREVFEAPDARVFLLSSGTAANALALATLTQPWQAILCHEAAHIQVSECNAPEFYTGGAKLLPVAGPDGRIDPDALATALGNLSDGKSPDTRRGPVSLTQVTDLGGVYSLSQIRAVTEVAKSFGCACHMDGARFANALVTLGCTPAEMTWKSGIDAVSFGGTKNGLIGAEAVIFFNPDHAYEFEHRRRRGGHLMSKQRYLAAQYLAYLTDDLWLDLAQKANTAAARLESVVTKIKGAKLLHARQANMIFAVWPRATHRRLLAAGAAYYVESGDPFSDDDPQDLLTARLVTNWATTNQHIEDFKANALVD